MSEYKSERRERQRRNSRKMKVSGKSVFLILRQQEKRAQEAERKAKRNGRDNKYALAYMGDS